MKSHIVNFSIVIGVAVLAILGAWFWMGENDEIIPIHAGLAIGKQAPLQMEAAGWLNGEPPLESDLKGKVVVVHAWSYF